MTVSLVACGDTSRPGLEPDLAGKPTWGGCRDFVGQNMDYAEDAVGERSRTAVLAQYRTEGDHVVIEPHHDHQRRRWLLVGDDNVIRAAVEMFHADQGWLANYVERCTD